MFAAPLDRYAADYDDQMEQADRLLSYCPARQEMQARLDLYGDMSGTVIPLGPNRPPFDRWEEAG